eukprot:TRINITY_DN4163_c0_g1_i3.p1 TRINITY_DN4163_c0_g1~~TRINITY_DN4163_c0_g1_i3.p1  ORF type:complete len:355 (+),score=164.70 TRINITY_DN4163_c0_g1_i3:44-1066(+)
MADTHIAAQGMRRWLDVIGERHCMKAQVVPLSEHPEFVKWALDDGTMRLPKTLQDREPVNHAHDYDAYTGEDVWADGDGDEEEEAPKEVADFPELIGIVDAFLKESAGSGIFPMSDTKTPYDATWAVASGEKLQCGCTTEVFNLLKASGNVTDDWHARAEQGLPLHLVLRKWYGLDQGLCFRGFVRDGCFVGVSQKRLSEFFPFLLDMKEEIVAAAVKVFTDAVQPKVADAEYAFDFYIIRSSWKAKLLGFHSWEDGTLLFDTAELRATAAPEKPHLHIIEDREEIVDCGVARGMRAGIPEELKDMSNLVQAAENVDGMTGGNVKLSVEEMIQMMKMQQE